jgi:hypothetical protein
MDYRQDVSERDTPWMMMLERLTPEEKRRAAAYYRALAIRLDQAGRTPEIDAERTAEAQDRARRFALAGESAARAELRGASRVNAVTGAAERFGLTAEVVELGRSHAAKRLLARIRERRDREALRLARRGLENRIIVERMRRRGYDVSPATLTRIVATHFRQAPPPRPRP